MKLTYKKSSILLFLSLMFCYQSCGIYSFTGANITAKSITIKTFPNKAKLIQPSLSQLFSNNLKDRFSQQTSLDQIKSGGELVLEGELIGYSVAPSSFSGDETVSQNRLTITVHVRFTNTLDDTQSFEQNFSRYADYDANKNLTEVEDELMTTICEYLIDDIFNKSVVNW